MEARGKRDSKITYRIVLKRRITFIADAVQRTMLDLQKEVYSHLIISI